MPLRALLWSFAAESLQLAVKRLRQGSWLWRLRAWYYFRLQLRVVNCKWYWSGCIKVVMVIWQQIFSLSNSFKKVLQKSPFLKLWRRDPGFGAAISAAIMYVKASLCKNWLCVKACSVQKLLRAKLLCVVCKSLLCVKGSACKSFFCVPKLLCVKSSLCKNFYVKVSLCKNICVSKLLCVKTYVCRSWLCKKFSVNPSLCKSFSV